jgi:hypothetical protein
MPAEESTPPDDLEFRPIQEARIDLNALLIHAREYLFLPPSSERQVIISLLFRKIVHDVQGSRILMEKSLLPQAGVILRSALESLIYQSSCAKNDQALSMFPKINDRENLITLGEEKIEEELGLKLSEIKYSLGVDNVAAGVNVQYFLSRSSLPSNFYSVYRYLSLPVHGLLFHLKEHYSSVDDSAVIPHSPAELNRLYFSAANIILANSLSIYHEQFEIQAPDNINRIVEKYIH